MASTKETHLPVREGYDAWAPLYDGDDNALVKLEERVVPGLLPVLEGLKVLDAGCGTGRHSLAMASAGAEVTAIDFSTEMLSLAKQKPEAARVSFLQGDIESPWPFGEDQFDLVTCFLVAEHLQDLAQLFGEAARVCRPGGSIVTTVMHPAMFLKGVTARFIDPETGQRRPIVSIAHTVSDYVTAAVSSGLVIQHISEHQADDALAAISPRAAKYVGWPILLVLKLGVSCG